MRRLGTAITLGLLLAGTAAYAADDPVPGVSGLTYFAKTTSNVGIGLKTFQKSGGPGNPIDVSGSKSASDSQTIYSAYVLENPDDTITFENSTIAGGSFASTSATTKIGFNFYDAKDVSFESLITPAGIGLYLANLEGCVLSACPKIGDGPGFPTLTDVQGSAFVRFNFSIQDNGQDLFRVSGVSSLVDGVLSSDFTNEDLLTGFGPAYNSEPQAYGFHWKETLVPRTLAGGTLHQLTYTTVVSSLVLTDPETSPCGLVGYAGFGDPIGRGGGALFSALFFQAGGAVAAAVAPCGADNDGGRPGIGFTPITLPKPVFENGVLRFGPDTSVPEPATWAMMILGFGGIGAVIRRRRTLGAHA